MSSLKFGQIVGESKDFHKQRQVADIIKIDINKIILFDRVLFGNRKDWRYIVGYEADVPTIIRLFIRTAKNIFNYGISQFV